jgi:hypothetical protein
MVFQARTWQAFILDGVRYYTILDSKAKNLGAKVQELRDKSSDVQRQNQQSNLDGPTRQVRFRGDGKRNATELNSLKSLKTLPGQ